MTAPIGSIEWLGESFQVVKPGSLPLMRFAKIAKAGVDGDTLDGLAAMYGMLEQCIHEDDFPRFEAHADDRRADGDELMEAVKDTFRVLSDRPTGRSSDSSDGPRTIEPNSTAVSSLPDTGPERVISRLNEQGRPDLALLIRRRQEESLSA